MTYCLAIKVMEGVVFASDSRSNAGVDYVSVYSKMHSFGVPGERSFILLTAGNLATTQAVVNLIHRDLDNPRARRGLNKAKYLHDAANYVGELSVEVQERHADALKQSGNSAQASFILGGQIKGRPPNVYRIYPEGNCITASPETPYLQIGESKYGKPILDRLVTSGMSLEDAARCALVSIDSTIRSNVSVGPPLELTIYRNDALAPGHHMTLKLNSPLYTAIQKNWGNGIKQAFQKLPRFDWEPQPPARRRSRQ
jgi:putative proteasome-type protease